MKARSIRPDPKTEPDADEFTVIDVELDRPREGREYFAGTVYGIAKSTYLGIPARRAPPVLPGKTTPRLIQGPFPDVESAAKALPEGFVPYVPPQR